MRVQMSSINQADADHAAMLAAMAEGRAARERYMEGISNRISEDQLRHLHLDAMSAAGKSERAASKYMGVRQVEYAI